MHKIVHLIDDARVGGVLTGLQQLVAMKTVVPGRHEVRVVASSNPLEAFSISTDTIVVHFAIAWRKIPFLVALRVLNPNSCLILQEHHYCEEFLGPENPSLWRFKTLFRLVSKIFDQVLAVSKTQSQWLASLGARVDRVISPMADLSELLTLPVRRTDDKPVVGVSGRLCKDKGIDLVLQLLEHPAATSFQFLFAGYGELEQQVVDAAERYANVDFMGRYDCPSEFLRRCDIVLIPSRRETFGLNCLEAKAAAKPVVVTRCSGLAEQAASCGVVVASSSPDSLARGLFDLTRLPNLKLLGVNARAAASCHNNEAQALWRATLKQGVAK